MLEYCLKIDNWKLKIHFMYSPLDATEVSSTRFANTSCAFSAFSSFPAHVFITESCNAREYENENGHGDFFLLPSFTISQSRSVASCSLCPPERNTTPATSL